MKKIAPKDIDKNVIKLIGQDWMLVTAGDQVKFNMMTDRLGSMGYLWKEAAGRVVFIFFLQLQKFRKLPGGEFSDDAAVCGGYS